MIENEIHNKAISITNLATYLYANKTMLDEKVRKARNNAVTKYKNSKGKMTN